MDLDVKQIELVDFCDDDDEGPKVFKYNFFRSIKCIPISKLLEIKKIIQETLLKSSSPKNPKDLLWHQQHQSSM